MWPEARAILFDLDDTLYPQRRFVFSGFAAVARQLAQSDGLDARGVFGVLRAAWRGGCRGRELQACLAHFGLQEERAAELLGIMREHRPVMRLPGSSARTLLALRAAWRTGIVTNGIPAMQARKVEALGVGALVDTVVFANEHGTGAGKPERAPFAAALARLGVAPEDAVFVGNDEACDIVGAQNAGMRTILVNAFRLKPEATWRHGEATWRHAGMRTNLLQQATETRATEARRHGDEEIGNKAIGNQEMDGSVSPSLRGPSRATAVVHTMADVPRVVAGMMEA